MKKGSAQTAFQMVLKTTGLVFGGKAENRDEVPWKGSEWGQVDRWPSHGCRYAVAPLLACPFLTSPIARCHHQPISSCRVADL